MKLICILVFAVIFAQGSELPLAGPCDEEACKLPNCRCFSTNIPGGLQSRETPQFVTITFDDAVTAAAMPNYREILYNRRNSNNCPVGATFFVSHEWTDYSAVNELYNNGFEIGLHSISHRYPQTFWRDASYNDIVEEIAEQRGQIALLANIPEDDIQGIRSPFLQLSGNTSYHVIKDHNLSYDSSWGTISYTNPGLWPYTLDYASNQDCQIPPCPSASLPGVWVQPLVAWRDLQGFPCGMADACAFPPNLEDADAWFYFILENFERHYMNNRAPFGIYIHEAYLRGWPKVKEAIIRFLNLITNLQDAFLVNADDVLDWVKDPVSILEYRAKQCKVRANAACTPNVCALTGAHNNFLYYMTACNTCPKAYPWVGNALGKEIE